MRPGILLLGLALCPTQAGAEPPQRASGTVATSLAESELPPVPVEDLRPRITPAQQETALPPVPFEQLRPRVAPSPQWDIGLLAGVCGLGRDQLWQETRFCGGAVVDATFLRQREQDGALGAYASMFTAGFADGRYGLGALGLLPINDLLVAQASAGPYLHSDGFGLSVGVEGSVSLALRALNPRGHYGHTHGLVLGVAHTPGSDSRGGTLLTIALRVDAFWVAMPFGRVF